jgi:hypothetical protein
MTANVDPSIAAPARTSIRPVVTHTHEAHLDNGIAETFDEESLLRIEN